MEKTLVLMRSRVVLAALLFTTLGMMACGAAEEKPAEAAPAPTADTTAPVEDSVVRDSASTRPVVTPNTPPPAQQ